ncbi:catechol 2,3-dioxygenase-like lactoylglutathione lyase family enzyme [Stackebrandtia endophytica]|uniref:Catechol 2,3-dioxygenase-like lactoylglutathione lyase family enzyme n=1 Tax=Stackebrandtia endophytica TaxID=1496996 RepID=A0A543B4D3_9ACTN|nr:VOC family protein [Stackebrandtia endophytica]TQL79681.1 catechol 2,3-dioxygenase-like lactoylglutathione lyase family enzyme [Stackebrandtia endophytica]
MSSSSAPSGTVHHIELWVPDLDRAVGSIGWLLTELGYEPYQSWSRGRSWRLGHTYLVTEESPAMIGDRHDRRAPGLNHLAFHVADRALVDRLTATCTGHGWTLMFPDRHPFAGGDDHYAAYLENEDGFEVELVAGRNL